MQSIKFVLVAVLAVFATQCQADEYPISADKVDLRLFVENGAAIARNMFKAVNTGLNQSKPNADKILNELAPEAKAVLRKAIDAARKKINEKEERITHIFNTLTKALDRLKPIKTCSDKVSPAAKKLAHTTETEFVKILKAIRTKHLKEFEKIQQGIEKITKAARTLFDTEVEAIVKCLTPGRKDSSDCLKKELNKTLEGTTKVILDAVILSQAAQETLRPIMPEIIEKALPLLSKTLENGQVILKDLGDCVANLK